MDFSFIIDFNFIINNFFSFFTDFFVNFDANFITICYFLKKLLNSFHPICVIFNMRMVIFNDVKIEILQTFVQFYLYFNCFLLKFVEILYFFYFYFKLHDFRMEYSNYFYFILFIQKISKQKVKLPPIVLIYLLF